MCDCRWHRGEGNWRQFLPLSRSHAPRTFYVRFLRYLVLVRATGPSPPALSETSKKFKTSAKSETQGACRLAMGALEGKGSGPSRTNPPSPSPFLVQHQTPSSLPIFAAIAAGAEISGTARILSISLRPQTLIPPCLRVFIAHFELS